MCSPAELASLARIHEAGHQLLHLYIKALSHCMIYQWHQDAQRACITPGGLFMISALESIAFLSRTLLSLPAWITTGAACVKLPYLLLRNAKPAVPKSHLVITSCNAFQPHIKQKSGRCRVCASTATRIESERRLCLAEGTFNASALAGALPIIV